MYTTQATLRNINLRTEFQGEDERQGAFDLKLEAPLTPELHDFLCKHTEKSVPIKSFSGSGIAEIKYAIELENVRFTINNHFIDGCKINKVIGKLGGRQIAVLRVQSQIHHKGLIDDLNDITGEPHTITIEEMQADMLDDGKDHTSEVSAKPAAENKSPSDTKPAPDKKKAVKKPSSKKDAGRKSDSTGLKVVGGEKVEMTKEQIAEAEAQKKSLLSRVTTNKAASDPASDEMQRSVAMVLDLEKVVMGQGDASDFDKMKDRIDAGKLLNMTQSEQLIELYNRYAA